MFDLDPRPAAIRGQAPSQPSGEPARHRDDRLRNLLGRNAWQRLPESVQRRFSCSLRDGAIRHYRGHVRETHLTWSGWLIANAARLIGAPLPLHDGATGVAMVTIWEDEALGGQVWSRVYATDGRLPQAIHSAKRFAGPTGLEEFLGPWTSLGVVMELTLAVDDGALVFEASGYGLSVLGRRLRLPAWLSPGRCRITHRDIGHGRFTFTLELRHPQLGLVCRQVAEFQDPD